jgi:putative transcriptional regulator
VIEPHTGSLLVAGPGLGDANFDRTIVYLLEHGPDGSLGVVINRPTQFEAARALPAWAWALGPPPVVFSGGPVEASSALGLARTSQEAVVSVDLTAEPSSLSEPIETARIFVGYSGWGAGQLDQELAAGAWFVVDAEPTDLFTAEPENLWGAILRREAARAAMAGRNPSWN